MIAYKFVTHEVPPLEDLSNTFAYKAKVKFLNGDKLTREERDRLFTDTWTEHGKISIHGWCFDFTPHLNEYWVKQKWYSILPYFAVDKTSIRNVFGHTVQKIVLVSRVRE